MENQLIKYLLSKTTQISVGDINEMINMLEAIKKKNSTKEEIKQEDILNEGTKGKKGTKSSKSV